jgi:hypothetical protein
MGCTVGVQFPKGNVSLPYRVMSGYVAHEIFFQWVKGSVTEDNTTE